MSSDDDAAVMGGVSHFLGERSYPLCIEGQGGDSDKGEGKGVAMGLALNSNGCVGVLRERVRTLQKAESDRISELSQGRRGHPHHLEPVCAFAPSAPDHCDTAQKISSY